MASWIELSIIAATYLAIGLGCGAQVWERRQDTFWNCVLIIGIWPLLFGFTIGEMAVTVKRKKANRS